MSLKKGHMVDGTNYGSSLGPPISKIMAPSKVP